jgi:hypothetical protein
MPALDRVPVPEVLATVWSLTIQQTAPMSARATASAAAELA